MPTSFTGVLIHRGQEGRYLLSGDGLQDEVRAGNVADLEDDGEHFDESPFAAFPPSTR
jgi:hypothetical protein